MTQSFGLPPTPFGPMPVASMAARMQPMQLHPQATGFNNPAAFHRSGMRPYGFEPPDSPEWGQPSVPPPPMPGSYVRSMSDAFAATSQGGNVHYNHPPPQGIHGKPPRQQNGLFDPARSGAQRKQQRKGGFWTKTFNLNVRSERRHAPPPGIDVTYAKPAAPEMFQSSARQFTPEPSYDYDEPSSASSVEEITSDEDNDDDDGSRPANPFLFAPKRSSLKRSAGPTHPQDDEWRSWHLPNVALEGMKKIKTLGEGSSGTVRCVKILNSPTSPELVGQVTALKTMRSEATESGAIEVAADKAIDKLASSPHSDDRTVFWASQHIARLVAKSIGHSDVPPSLHTEYCEGGEVMDYLNAHGGREDLRIQFATELLQATHVCHAANIVHLDIKVENAFIALCGPKRKPVLKLGDFGGAMRVPIVGAPRACSFPPPEVTLCKHQAPLSTSWDIWSVGITIANIMGSNPDAAVRYQTVSNIRAQRSIFPIHEIQNIIRLRHDILNKSEWQTRRPARDLLRWLAAALSFDEGRGTDQSRPSAMDLHRTFPRTPYA